MDRFIKVRSNKTAIRMDENGNYCAGVVYGVTQLINLKHIVRIEVSEAYGREGVIKGELNGSIEMDDGRTIIFYPYTVSSIENTLNRAMECDAIYEFISKDMQEDL